MMIFFVMYLVASIKKYPHHYAKTMPVVILVLNVGKFNRANTGKPLQGSLQKKTGELVVIPLF